MRGLAVEGGYVVVVRDDLAALAAVLTLAHRARRVVVATPAIGSFIAVLVE